MKLSISLKYAFLMLVFFTTTKFVHAQDTATYFFKITRNAGLLVHSADSADYVRLIPPYSSSDRLITINDYFKNGKVKLIAKGRKSTLNKVSGNVRYEGSCIDFYPSGKRKAISNYKDGEKVGEQYLYYPDGKLCTTLNYKMDKNYGATRSFIIDFYDRNGGQICKDGNGSAIEYNSQFDEIIKGPVKNGHYDGEWFGTFSGPDTIKFMKVYKDGVFHSGTGYDAAGKAYPFEYSHSQAWPTRGAADFIEDFKNNIKLPKNSGVTKAMIDSINIDFIVENTGQLSNFKTDKPVLPVLMDALRKAFDKCAKWRPAAIYGIPQQTKIDFSLNVINYSTGRSIKYSQTFLSNGVPIDFGKNETP